MRADMTLWDRTDAMRARATLMPETPCLTCGRPVVLNAMKSHLRIHDEAGRQARFWSRVDRRGPDECWEWQGFRQANGYGALAYPKGVTMMAHRLAYELLVAPIPDGLHIDHLCRNRACVNPAHLEPVTPRENNLRGFGASGMNARKERCINGHPFSGHNLRVVTRRSGLRVRVCRQCAAEAMRTVRARRAAA